MLANGRFSNGQPTIGLLISHLDRGYMGKLWPGVADIAQEHGVNLLCFVGGTLHSPVEFEVQRNILYNLASPQSIDGFVVTCSMFNFTEQDKKEQFFDCYRTLPKVSTAVQLIPGIPNVLVDNAMGMHDLLRHLIESHHYRRIAFMKGPEHNQDAQQRYQVYVDVLASYDIPLEPKLIVPGDFNKPSGALAMRVLLDQRKLCPGSDIEVVVASNDDMACGALEVLAQRGIQVPNDLAVAGFDNIEESGFTPPPLTTVQQPLYEQGRRAVELLLAQLGGRDVPELTLLPSKLVVRQSCGCISSVVLEAGKSVERLERRPIEPVFREQREIILAEIVKAVAAVDIHAATRLTDGFISEMTGTSPGMFISALHEILWQVTAAGGDITEWQNALSVLRHYVLSCSDDAVLRAEPLLQQGRVVIGEIARQVQGYQWVQSEQLAEMVSAIGQALITAFDLRELTNILARELPRLNIPGCYLSLYETSPQDIEGNPRVYEYPQPASEWSRLILAYHKHERVTLEPGGRRFLSHQLVPEEFLNRERPHHLVIEPLYFRAQQIGVVVFEVGPQDGPLYEKLRGQISSALQGALLVQRVQEHYRLLAENMRDGVLILQEGRVVFTNAAFAAMTGYAPEQFDSRDPVSLFWSTHAHTVQQRLGKKERALSETQWQAELLTSVEETMWVEVEQAVTIWNGQAAILLTIRNIHQRKLQEQHLEEERERLQHENVTLKSSMKDRYRFGEIIGKSRTIQQVYKLILSAAKSDANTLIVGESGTGKELIARTIHQSSARKKQAMVPVNCASIPETLFEREFFGHRKGAFTGADRDHAGLFDRAHRGVLFLDEVTELTPGTQAKLLRVLQDGEYTPLGSNTPKQADVLIIAATNRDCQVEIEHGRLRQDFFYRVCVIEIGVPPLRERKDDLPLLIDHMLELYHRKQEQLHRSDHLDLPTDATMLPGELVEACYAYHWPGNIRELQNILHRYLATGQFPSILSASPSSNRTHRRKEAGQQSTPTTNIPTEVPLTQAMQAFEKQVITEALRNNRHRIGKTAEALDVPLRTLQRKIKQYRIKR